MPRLNSNHLDLVGVWIGDAEELFDGLFAIQGAHLRWSFVPTLGFPRDGFTLHKYDSFGALLESIDIHVPTTETEYLARIVALNPTEETALRNRYEPGANDLIDALNNLGDESNPIPARTRFINDTDSDPLHLKIMDVIMVASLDPYIAYGLGLYYVDTLDSIQDKFSYRLTGDWLDQIWPDYTINLNTLTKMDVRNKWANSDLVLVSRGREFTIEKNETDGSLINCNGAAATSLRFIFPFPISVLEIGILHLPIPSHEWRVELEGGRDALIESSPSSEVISIQAEDEGTFTHLDLSSNFLDQWTIRSIRYREFKGEIKKLESETILLTSTPTSVVAPEILTLQHSYLPPSLSQKDGEVASSNQIELAAFAPASEMEALIPVRAHVARTPFTTPPRTSLTDDDIVTIHNDQTTPAIYAHYPLIAYWPLSENAIETRTKMPAVTHGTKILYAEHPNDLDLGSFHFKGQNYLEISDRPDLQSIGSRLTIRARFKLTGDGIHQTIIGNNLRESFLLGLTQVRDGFKINFWFNERLYESSQTIEANTWCSVHIRYDGETLAIFINDGQDSVHNVTGSLAANTNQVLCIGASDSSIYTGRITNPFKGKICEVSIWRQAIDPFEVNDLLKQAMPAVQFIDQHVPDGQLHYYIQGIDLFGRVSDWSPPKEISVTDISPPVAPIQIRAKYKPILGGVDGTVEREEVISTETVEGVVVTRSEIQLHLSLQVDTILTATQAAILQCDKESGGHGGYDLIIWRVVGDSPDAKQIKQNFEILSATAVGDMLNLIVQEPPFTQIIPANNDKAMIEYDINAVINWGWSGRQQLFYPDVREFRIYEKSGSLNTITGFIYTVKRDLLLSYTFTLSTSANIDVGSGALQGSSCIIGKSRYRIDEHTIGANAELKITYLAYPVIPPKQGATFSITLPKNIGTNYSLLSSWAHSIPEVTSAESDDMINLADHPPVRFQPTSEEQINALRREGVTWLPKKNVYWFDISGTSIPQTSPSVFITGAIVGFNLSHNPHHWEVFDVIWLHSITEGTRLYLANNKTREEGEAQPNLVLMRYYLGTRYEKQLSLPGRFTEKQATKEYKLAITAADDQRLTPHPTGDTDRYGNESSIPPITNLIAVNRQRPLPPQRPKVLIGRADYYGKAEASISWDSETTARSVLYNIYRAVDSAIFTRDLELRRKKLGHYQDITSEQVFSDDFPDTQAWIDTLYSDYSTNWQSALFPEVDSAEWKSVTKIWRAWSERFYPALTQEELMNLAERRGIENAFVRVNKGSIEENSYVDTVQGTTINRYLYRIQSETHALQHSAQLSPSSIPVQAIQTRPPEAPTILEVIPGDREISIDWKLSADPNVIGYRIYRSENKEDLEDLRWFEEGRDPRLVADETDLTDPRLRAINREVDVSSIDDISSVIGVYRADEFNFNASPENQEGVYNYLPEVIDEFIHPVISIRRIQKQIPVIIVYKNASNEINSIDRIYRTSPHTDENLKGLNDYFYCITSTNIFGTQSNSTSIFFARTLEIEPPSIPNFELYSEELAERLTEVGLLISGTSEEGTEVLVEKQSYNSADWATVLPWSALNSTRMGIETLFELKDVTYRIAVRSSNKRLALERTLLSFSADMMTI